jgi:uncharacterized protein
VPQGAEPEPTTALEVVAAIYDAFARKDLEAVLTLTSPDIVVTQDPALPWGGRFEGHDGLGRFVMALLGSIDSAVTIEDMFQAGDHVVQHGRTAGTVRSNGASFDIPECHVWRVEDGVAVEAQYFIDSSAMLEVLGRS